MYLILFDFIFTVLWAFIHLVLQKEFIMLWNTEQNMIVPLASRWQVSKESQAGKLKYQQHSLCGVELCSQHEGEKTSNIKQWFVL